jgi:hypothetical protein
VAGYGAARRFSKKIYLRNRTLPPVTALVIGIRLAANFLPFLGLNDLANWKNITYCIWGDTIDDLSMVKI